MAAGNPEQDTKRDLAELTIFSTGTAGVPRCIAKRIAVRTDFGRGEAFALGNLIYKSVNFMQMLRPPSPGAIALIVLSTLRLAVPAHVSVGRNARLNTQGLLSEHSARVSTRSTNPN